MKSTDPLINYLVEWYHVAKKVRKVKRALGVDINPFGDTTESALRIQMYIEVYIIIRKSIKLHFSRPLNEMPLEEVIQVIHKAYMKYSAGKDKHDPFFKGGFRKKRGRHVN